MADFLARERESLEQMGDETILSQSQEYASANDMMDTETCSMDTSTSPMGTSTSPMRTPASSMDFQSNVHSGMDWTTAPLPKSPSAHSSLSTPSSPSNVGIVNGVQKLSLSGAGSPSPSTTTRLHLDDSIHIREWKAKREAQLREAGEREKVLHQEVLAKAQKEIEQFYEEYNRLKMKNAALNR